MILSTVAKCTSKPKPREWTYQDRKGITYKVDISDGESTVQIQCNDIEVYNKFEPFQDYTVSIDLVQTNFDGRLGVKAIIVDCEVA